ncbi:MAG: hypothetical protein K2U26_01870 [Cyclobacteriaceae bacterium]|nr:hypothetical protein [Cyclobacteriaceae bacterium]
MKRITLPLSRPLQTMSWRNDYLIDWADGGTQYYLNGEVDSLGSYSYRFPFDSAVTSADGHFAVIYQKLGTKGLLLKDGEIFREINRSYYLADTYEFPVAFAKTKGNQTLLIRCPNGYNQIDFEDAETGEILTSVPDRNPSDFFHSRFEVSFGNSKLMSKGWIWQPFDFISVFDIDACIQNPLLLDNSALSLEMDDDIYSASFISDNSILIGPSFREVDIALGSVSESVSTNQIIGGHLTAIDDTFAWDLYNYPKIINYKTGEVIDNAEDIASGHQTSSIIHHLKNEPKIAFNQKTKQVAIANGERIVVLSKD